MLTTRQGDMNNVFIVTQNLQECGFMTRNIKPFAATNYWHYTAYVFSGYYGV